MGGTKTQRQWISQDWRIADVELDQEQKSARSVQQRLRFDSSVDEEGTENSDEEGTDDSSLTCLLTVSHHHM